MNTNTVKSEIVTAGQLVVGDQVAEADGFLWTIREIERSKSGRTITLVLVSDFSSFRSHWSTESGARKTLRASSRVYRIPAPIAA
jgi:hypothetical protein